MASNRHSSLDRVLGRLDSLDMVNLTKLVQRLARERGLFEQIFNTLQEGILVIGVDGMIDYANDAAERLVGMGGEAGLAGQTLWRLVPGLRVALETAFGDEEGTAPILTREFELAYPEPRSVRLYMVPFRGPVGGGRGDARRHVVILTDITRDRQTTERRIEDERTSSILLLAAGVAHELGNPLNSLTIHLQLAGRKLARVKGGGAAIDAVKDSVRVCQQEVTRLDGIITHFLEAIRPRPPDLSETNLAEILAEVLSFQKDEFAAREIVVEAETPADLPAVMADRGQVKQACFNVLKNALDAMQPGGRLRIKFRTDDESVFLLFGDTGVGIRQEDLSRLFQPYHTTKATGHGLGLMIVQRILRAHGGQVGIESKEGVGTVVTLQFPRKDRRVRMLES